MSVFGAPPVGTAVRVENGVSLDVRDYFRFKFEVEPGEDPSDAFRVLLEQMRSLSESDRALLDDLYVVNKTAAGTSVRVLAG